MKATRGAAGEGEELARALLERAHALLAGMSAEERAVLWLGVALCGALLLGWGWRRVRRWWWRGEAERTLKRRQRKAERAEEAAVGVLRAHGYEIEQEQAEFHWEVGLDGEPYPVELRADYIVRRGGRRYVAEVKSGSCAPSLSTAATRRQLLEYRVAYPVDGILLVDMEAVQLHEVDFGERVEGRKRGWRLEWGSFTLGVGVSVALFSWWLFG